MQQTTLNYAEAHFSEICLQVIEEQNVLLVMRDNSENVVMMPQSLFDAWQKQTQQQTLTIPKLNPLHSAKAPSESFQAINQENGLKKLFASWSPLEEEFPEIADALPIDLKIQLIDKLLNSLNLSQHNVEVSWQKEAEKRILEVQSGLVVPEDGEQVFADIWQRLKE